ncbi:hypothetical protein ACGFJC_25080 [Nonomuraea fuscirosea]|uniref:hypothetical protein n=1 Tax=Nonomuraea fuscirosea TaxID=1291556 RepID=UPI00341CEB43
MSAMWRGCLADTDYLYVLDGNWAVGMTAPLIVTQLDLALRLHAHGHPLHRLTSSSWHRELGHRPGLMRLDRE